MAPTDINQRIVLSRHTLAKFEQGAIDDAHHTTLALIVDEISILRSIVAAHPEKALTVGDLVQRWEALADRLRVKVH